MSAQNGAGLWAWAWRAAGCSSALRSAAESPRPCRDSEGLRPRKKKAGSLEGLLLVPAFLEELGAVLHEREAISAVSLAALRSVLLEALRFSED